MPVTIPNTFVGAATLSASNLDGNFSTIASYTSAIPGSDIQATTISNSALVNTNFEFEINLASTFITTGGSLTTSTTIPIALAGMPNVSGDTASYVVQDGGYAITDTGNGGTLTFHVEHGYFSSGTWTIVGSNVANNISVAGAVNGNNGNTQGTITINAGTLTMQASNRTFLALFVTASSSGLLNCTAGGQVQRGIYCSFRCTRTGGLRS